MKESNVDVNCLICYAKMSGDSIVKHLQLQHKNTIDWNMIIEKRCADLCWLKQDTDCDGENLTEKACNEELRQLGERKDLIMEMKTLFDTIEKTLKNQTAKRKKSFKIKSKNSSKAKKSSPSVKRKATDTTPRRTSRKQIQTGNGFYIRHA